MKTFYHLLANTLLSSVTNMTVWFALTFFVYLETQSVAAASIVSGLYLVAVTLSGFWFGSLVDHHKKKHMMLLSSFLSLLAYVAGFALYTSAAPGAFQDPSSATLWTLVPLLLGGVIVGNIRGIALPTVITLLFPEGERDRANGMAGTANGVAFLVVSVISGLLVAHSGMYAALLLAIAISLATLVHLWAIPIPEREVVHADGQRSEGIDIRGTIAILSSIPGLIALILFTTFNNFLGGIFMALMDAYGLTLVSVEVWGLLWGFLSCGFIVGGLIIARVGLGVNPLRSLFLANIAIWIVSSVFTLQSSILLLTAGMFIYLCVVPFIEASEHTIIQKVVPEERQGRVFGFAQSIEMAASPLTAFFIGPVTEFLFIPFMTTGAGVELIGGWFGTGPDRGMALVFTLTGLIGLAVTLLAMASKSYRLLSNHYLQGTAREQPHILLEEPHATLTPCPSESIA